MKFSGKTVVHLILVLLSLNCTGKASPQAAIDLSACQLEHAGLRALCGGLEVPENRAEPDGRKIRLNIAVVPALAQTPRPDPLFILVGGPGEAATDSGAMMARAFRKLRKERDIVLVDQRGTGESNLLRCDADVTAPLAERLRGEIDPDEMSKCLRELDADPTHYTTPVAMDDLDAVRAALGYEKINLWGGSYGTRAALVYMRRYPEHVRRVILDGTAPMDIKLTLHVGRDAQRALDLMFERCEADEHCSARFGDLRSSFDALRTRLAATPEDVTLVHPRTGEPQQLTIDDSILSTVVRTILYAPVLVATLPLALDRAVGGDWTPLFAATLMILDGIDHAVADGMFLSVVCAEDVSQITDEERALLADNFIGDKPVQVLVEACAMWPHAKLPASYFEPIVESHPTLVLSGELDPVTPPSWGDLVAGRLPNATHHVVKGVGHGVSAIPCATKAIAEFLDAAAPADVVPACEAADAYPYFVNPAGSRP